VREKRECGEKVHIWTGYTGVQGRSLRVKERVRGSGFSMYIRPNYWDLVFGTSSLGA
jgi:hypothetical protein